MNNSIATSYVVGLEERNRFLEGRVHALEGTLDIIAAARAKTAKRIRAYRAKYQTEVTDPRADYDIVEARLLEYKEALAEEKMEVWRLRLALKFASAALTEAAAS